MLARPGRLRICARGFARFGNSRCAGNERMAEQERLLAKPSPTVHTTDIKLEFTTTETKLDTKAQDGTPAATGKPGSTRMRLSAAAREILLDKAPEWASAPSKLVRAAIVHDTFEKLEGLEEPIVWNRPGIVSWFHAWVHHTNETFTRR
jgi:hypothetical protein